MRRRFFNAADNFVGGCYNKLSNEEIKRLGGKRPYVCQFNKIHIHIGPVLKDIGIMVVMNLWFIIIAIMVFLY